MCQARLMSVPNVGQRPCCVFSKLGGRWNEPDADWLCLEHVDVLPAATYV